MSNFFLERLNRNAKKYGSRVAIRFLEEQITYLELDNETDLIAQKIKKFIYNSEQRAIVIYQSRGIQFIKYIIAILKCNCYYVPLENTVPIERLKYIYNDVNALMIISENEVSLEDNYKVLNPSNITKLETVNISSSNHMEKDLVYVMYTSGTSGKPKGVKIKYSNLKNLVYSFNKIVYHNFDNKVNVGVIASFCFDASVKQIFCALFYGHSLIIADGTVRYFGSKIHRFLNQNDIMICDMTPSHLKLMLLQKKKEKSKTPYLIIGGEKLTWNLLKNYKKDIDENCTFINVYGPTECCVDVSYNIVKEVKKENGNVPIGVPLDNTQLILIDDNGSRITEPYIIGELYVYGKQVGSGYVNDVKNSFIKNINNEIIGYKTGDLGEYNDDMEIIILSRKDRQVKLNGFRIELDEISVAIEEYCSNQSYVCLFEINNSLHLVAFIVGRCREREVIEHLKKVLVSYMIPKKIVSVKEIPLTDNGKVDEKKLLNIYKYGN